MRKRILALLLASIMLAGQTVYAEDVITEGNATQESGNPEELKNPQESENPNESESTNKSENLDDAEITQGSENKRGEEENFVDSRQNGVGTEQQLVEEKTVETNGEETYLEFSKTVYTNYPVVETVELQKYSGIQEILKNGIIVESEDTAICAGKKIADNGDSTVYLELDGQGEGETTILLKDINQNIICKYHITVKTLPEDAAIIEDIMLRKDIIADGDSNKDGYVSKDELASMTNLIAVKRPDLPSIVSLSGLEGATNLNFLNLSYNESFESLQVIQGLKNLEHLRLCDVKIADLKWTSGLTNLKELDLKGVGINDIEPLASLINLEELNLSGNTELEDIKVLSKLDKLSLIGLNETAVSAEAEWELAGFTDMSINKGDKIVIPKIRGLMQKNGTLEVRQEGDSKQIKVERQEHSNDWEVTGIEAGKSQLHITYADFEANIFISVEGTSAEQEVGEPMQGEADIIASNGESAMAVLNSNGELWTLYPEAKKVKSNVKKYVADTIYYEKKIEYLLDKNNTLWNGKEKIAENVVEFDGYYAMNEAGVLIDIYSPEKLEITDVVSWEKNIRVYGENKRYTYMLKTDGTLWRRRVNGEDEKGEIFEQVDSEVTQLTPWAYLKADGTIIQFILGTSLEYKDKIGTKAVELLEFTEGFYGENEELYVVNYIFGVELEACGKIRVKDCQRGVVNWWFFLTENNEFYEHWSGQEGSTKRADGVRRLNQGRTGDWNYQTEDGTFYRVYEDDTEAIVESATLSSVYFQEGNTYHNYRLKSQHTGMKGVVLRNEVAILNCVTDMWKEKERVYAFRTDGTVWDITDVPKQILDITKNTEDLTGDQKENIINNIETANKDENVQVEMGTAVNLPEEVLAAAESKGVTLQVAMGNGLTWVIDGTSIDKNKIQDTNLEVIRADKEGGNISPERVDAIAGDRAAEQLNLTHNGEFGFKASLIIGTDAGLAEQKCVALWDNNGELIFMTNAIVQESQVEIGFSHASDYLLVYAKNGDVSGDNKLSTVDLMKILHDISSKKKLDALGMGIADVNLDRKVSTLDLMKVLHVISGKSQGL